VSHATETNADHWQGKNGQRWARLQAQTDAQLGPFGRLVAQATSSADGRDMRGAGARAKAHQASGRSALNASPLELMSFLAPSRALGAAE
jgi:hypothetical protein